MLHMQNISKVFRTDLIETHALRDFNLHVREGEFVAVTGPSGSGKTTFLNIAGLLETFDTGSYKLDGEDVSRLSDDERSRIRNQKIGFIFQSFNLIPDLDLFDNVDVPLRYRGFNAPERKKRITEALEIPTIGIGAGAACDGQVLVWHDVLGLYEGRSPRFVKQYANLAEEITRALGEYVADVRSGAFPESKHTYAIPADELAEFEETLGAHARR